MLASVKWMIHYAAVLCGLEMGVFEINVIYLNFCMIHGMSFVSGECVGSREWSMIFRQVLKIFCHCNNIFLCAVMVCCIHILLLHCWCLLCLACHQRVFLDGNTLCNHSCCGTLSRWIQIMCVCLILDA